MDSGSGGRLATETARKLIDDKRGWEEGARYTPEGGLNDAADRQANTQRVNRCYDWISEIDNELDYRERRRAERTERAEQKQRPSLQDGRPHQGPRPDGPPSPMKMAGDAVRDYFVKNNINTKPRYQTVRIDLAWDFERRHFLGIYAAATQALSVWVKVDALTEGSTVIGGNYYMPVV